MKSSNVMEIQSQDINNIILSFKNISKRFGQIDALSEVSIDVPQNSIYGILGPNGSGKSTLMRILANLILNYSGTIKYKNKIFNPKNNEIASLGFLIENPSFYEYLTARQNLNILSRISDVNESKIDEILELVNLKKRQNDKVHTYSYGMKQRLGLAQTLLHNPEILILDEPNNGLDPNGINDMSTIIKNLHKTGKTILLSTHILSEVESLCSHFTILNNGKNISNQNMNDILKNNNKYCIEVDNVQEAINILNSDSQIKIISNNSNQIKFSTVTKIDLNQLYKLFNSKVIIYQFYKNTELIEFFND